MISKSKVIKLIYAGGTFGSHGKPLTALPASKFVPVLVKHIYATLSEHIELLDNPSVKDSSQLTPKDFAHFYQLILSSYACGNKKFILISGTDTLSYLGSFLAEAFAGSDIRIVLTASMCPLLKPEDSNYRLNPKSDAWSNFVEAVKSVDQVKSGVYVVIGNECWPAQSVLKIHSHQLNAFNGHHINDYPASSYTNSLNHQQQEQWISAHQNVLQSVLAQAKQIVMLTVYCVPQSGDWLAVQLQQLTSLSETGVILIGFGAGNIPYSNQLSKTMDELYKQGHMLVCTTQCPYGGVSGAYSAGSWQYEHHVLSAGNLTISSVYSRLLWLHLAYDSPKLRLKLWQQHLIN